MRRALSTILAVLASMAALTLGGLVFAPSAQAAPIEAKPTAAPACLNARPGPDFYAKTRHNNPNACGKCQTASWFYDSTKFESYCWNRYNPAGTLTAVDLYLRCIACRAPADRALPQVRGAVSYDE